MFFFSLAKRAAATALIVFVAAPAFAQSPTRTRLVTQSPSPVGRPVTMTAEVDSLGGGAPRGSVSFADGATDLGSAPLTVPGAGQATLAAGWSHTCALTSAGGVKCWGDNSVRPARRRHDDRSHDAGRCRRPHERYRRGGGRRRPYLRAHQPRRRQMLGLRMPMDRSATGRDRPERRRSRSRASRAASSAIAAGGSHTCALTSAAA